MIITLAFAALSLAAVPPMSADERAQDAQLIAVGTVEKLESRDVDVDDGTDTRITVTLKVAAIEKELIASKKRPKTLTFEMKRTGKRPEGWTGPVGQNSVPKKGDRIRIFGRYDASGVLWLMEPNGWDAAPVKL